MKTLCEGRAAMGTRFEIVCHGEDEVQLRAAAEEALDEVERVEAQLSIFRDESDLFGINARAAFEAVRADPQVAALLALARAVAERTGGAFDPTVAPIARAWRVTRDGQLPAEPELERARGCSGWPALCIDTMASTVRFLVEGMSLDLGAIGKGFGIDRAVECLRLAGVDSALIHGGTSTVYALGSPPHADGWQVAIRNPEDGDSLLGTVTLRDRAMSVSAPHGQGTTVGGSFYGHVLDPRTGRPVAAGQLAAAVHPSATLTDAVSTALLVAGGAGLSEFGGAWRDLDLLLLAGGLHVSGDPERWSQVRR